MLSVLVRLASGEAGRDGGWWWVAGADSVGGVLSLVMAGMEVVRRKRKSGQTEAIKKLVEKVENCGVNRLWLPLRVFHRWDAPRRVMGFATFAVHDLDGLDSK